MIDVHAHILPGVDDGARSVEEALEMAREACRQGTQCIIVTPHSEDDGEWIFSDTIRDAYAGFAEELKKNDIPLTIYIGQEIFYFDGVVEHLKSGKLCTLADSLYTLLEFAPQVSWRELYQGVRKVVQAGYWPVIAHAERYTCLRNDENLYELLEAGAYIQINARSLCGKPWDGRVRWSRKMILNGNVHFLGTDMHRIDYRSPEISKERAWLERHVDAELLQQILWENPMKITEGKRLQP